MKLHYEASIAASAEAVIDLDAEEAAEYQALTTEEERTAWLQEMVVDTFDDYIVEQTVDTWHAFIQEEDGDAG